ncbi:hypothetical protein HPB48_010766 [Haemaphysalis longicornis]|uniref:FYVE-type domain-containing protein n=1 Tax=Haemaphysalis longicornis TaxID=44386 RepID=A0A9J6GR85_HAELO|nr:hypothetical protein HPB48_010766 [Haemaphysalis longicornis]
MGEVKEGYLCPICVEDLGNFEELTAHFEANHASGERDVLNSLKGLFGRRGSRRLYANRVLMNELCTQGAPDERSFKTPRASMTATRRLIGGSRKSVRVSKFLSWRRRNALFGLPGVIQDHTATVRQVRARRVDRYVGQSNKLLVRLTKLVVDAPSDPEMRKARDKALVPWVDDADVKLCPSCAKSFSISRRRHHCRLCGGIMCQLCSEFLDSATVQQLVASAGSPADHVCDEPLRLCRDCRVLLDRRLSPPEQPSPLLAQYERMRKLMDEAERLLPGYYRLIDGIREGRPGLEEEAKTVRARLIRVAEQLDLISRQLGSGGTTPRQLQLRGALRLAASHFLRQGLLGLPGLPKPQPQPEQGWSPSSVRAPVEEEDPLAQQMAIIRGYIQQARQSQRYEELASLEANLQELKQEYLRRTLATPSAKQ